MGLICNKFEDTMYLRLKNSIKKASEIYINVSFIRDSGMKLLIEDLKNAELKGTKIKILTSDYLGITEPNALYRLKEIKGTKIFKNERNISFHPKTYIFKYSDETIEILIGSSNISYSALITGVEWNYNFKGSIKDEKIKIILKEFDELYEKNSFELSLKWLRNYEKQYRKNDMVKLIDSTSGPINEEFEPIKFQIPALYELSKTREEGYKKAMTVIATGLGKTYLAAFDSLNFNKILFLVHREEILQQARVSFENIHKKSKNYGYFKGDLKEVNKDIIFANVSTLGKEKYLNSEYFSSDYFDYIVVDEFHHADSPSYRKVLNYFKPSFLLGLTATPERTDSGDIFELCDYNIAYECDLSTGINNGWLVPFEYLGIYDDINYENIPWRSGKYDMEMLENTLIIEERAKQIYINYLKYKITSTVGFCAGIKHAEFMNKYFLEKKIKSAVITGRTSMEERKKIIRDFKEGNIKIIFTVDVLNEGVDIPSIDTILFLRPTSSYTIFMQQLGRGLRTYTGKEKLRILDFVGNYKGAELKPGFLIGEYSKIKNKIINPLEKNFKLPEGCSAIFDLKLLEYFKEKSEINEPIKTKILNDFKKVSELINKTPNILEIYSYGELPVQIYLQKFSTWVGVLLAANKITELYYSTIIIDFFELIEKTSMTRSYKIPLLLSLFGTELKREVKLEEIANNFKIFYSDKLHEKDLIKKNLTIKQFEKLALENPIKYITTSGNEFFSYENKKFKLNEKLYDEIKEIKIILKENIWKKRYNYEYRVL